MCGILGLLDAHKPVLDVRLRDGLQQLVHRGPDGEGAWSRASVSPPFVALGHRRLAIIDLSDAARQPMISSDGLACVTFNGEIYNYREIRHELKGAGLSFDSASDTEVLLCAYRRWGHACLAHLNGMFAFAIWDEANKELFAARDRFGEKPFFYALGGNETQFGFASEIKALLACGAAGFGLNERALARYVKQGVLDGGEETIYQGVRRLPPASAVRVCWKSGRWDVRQWRYWSLPDPSPSDSYGSREAATFRELFEDSVRLRLRSDVAVGTSLSGGLDSSAVVCMIRRLGAEAGQKTFSARMQDPTLDEGKYIEIVRGATGIEGYEVTPTAEELRRQFAKLCRHMEEPFPATSMFAQFLVMRLASEKGVTVILDGQGADELLGGYAYYFRLRYGDLIRRLEFRETRREFASFAALHGGCAPMTAKGVLASFLTAKFDESWLRRETSGKSFGRLWTQQWLSDLQDAEDDVAGEEPYIGRFESRLRHDATGGPLQELLRFGDRNSMAWSRELRQPFLDHRLAEFAFSTSANAKISRGMTKRMLRDAMRPIVPGEILDRHDKLGYQAPQGQWLDAELSPWVREQIEAVPSEIRSRLEAGSLSRRLDQGDARNEFGFGRELFRVLTLARCFDEMKRVVARHD